MVEGSDLSLDTAIYIQSERGGRNLVPVRPDVPAEKVVPSVPEPEPEPISIDQFQHPADMEMNADEETVPPSKKNKWFYMKEFVGRASSILQAMQAREALPDSNMCAECSRSMGHWRCEDCIERKLLCRMCMRHSHFSNPFHRIECWTGTYFRKAALWQVGIYLILPHQNGGICPNLLWQKEMLEKIQKKRDNEVPLPIAEQLTSKNYDREADLAPEPEVEAVEDETEMHFLDQLLAGHHMEEMIEDQNEENDLVDMDDVQDTDAGIAGFTNYMNDRLGPDPNIAADAPSCDALNNQYIQVVHTNGIHHIALVSCTCQGDENVGDFIFAGWVPTSFIRVRTIFTAAVLDHFRYCNLEMRSSAHQLFQLL